LLAGGGPFVGGDADEVIFLTLFEGTDAFAHERVDDDDVRFAVGGAGGGEGGEQRGEVVAVDALGVPAEGGPFFVKRLDAEDARRRAVGLLVVAIDDGDEAVEFVVCAGEGGFPRGAFLALAVGEKVEDAGVAVLQAEAERHADGLREAVAEGAAGQLDAGRGFGRGHFEARTVGAVGGKFVDRKNAGLGERGVEADGVVADGENEAVAVGPGGLGGTGAQLGKVDDREEIGDAEALTDVALADDFGHVEDVAAHGLGAGAERGGVLSEGEKGHVF